MATNSDSITTDCGYGSPPCKRTKLNRSNQLSAQCLEVFISDLIEGIGKFNSHICKTLLE